MSCGGCAWSKTHNLIIYNSMGYHCSTLWVYTHRARCCSRLRSLRVCFHLEENTTFTTNDLEWSHFPRDGCDKIFCLKCLFTSAEGRWAPHLVVSSRPGDIRANIFQSRGRTGFLFQIPPVCRSRSACVPGHVAYTSMLACAVQRWPRQSWVVSASRRSVRAGTHAGTHSWKVRVYARRDFLTVTSPSENGGSHLTGRGWVLVRLAFFFFFSFFYLFLLCFQQQLKHNGEEEEGIQRKGSQREERDCQRGIHADW